MLSSFQDKALQIFNDFFNQQSNAFELHIPLIIYLIDNLLKGKLLESEYPFYNNEPNKNIPNKLFLYIIGGVTYLESKHIGMLNQKYSDKLFILGGTSIPNSK